MTTLEQKIYDALVKALKLNPSDIEGTDENSPLFESDIKDNEPSFNLDSLDSLELVVMIEHEWNIEVPTEDMKLLTTIKNIANYINEHMESK